MSDVIGMAPCPVGSTPTDCRRCQGFGYLKASRRRKDGFFDWKPAACPECGATPDRRKRTQRVVESITLSRFWCRRIHPLFKPLHYYRGARAVGTRRSALWVAILETLGK